MSARSGHDRRQSHRAPLRRTVEIDGGVLLMGSDDPEGTRFGGDGESPVRETKIGGCLIEDHAVTNAEFASFVQAIGYATEAEHLAWSFVFFSFLAPTLRGLCAAHPETPWWLAVPGAYWARPEGPASALGAVRTIPWCT